MESENTVKHAALAVLRAFPSPQSFIYKLLCKNNGSGYKQPLNAFSSFTQALSFMSNPGYERAPERVLQSLANASAPKWTSRLLRDWIVELCFCFKGLCWWLAFWGLNQLINNVSCYRASQPEPSGFRMFLHALPGTVFTEMLFLFLVFQ